MGGGRFEEYCRRKTEAAIKAHLHGFRSLHAPSHTPGGMVAIGNEWSTKLFEGWFYRSEPDTRRQLPAVSLVFVQSADYNTGADDPSTLGGGDTDKHLVYEGLSRVDAHAVLAGARTASGNEIVFSIWHPELVRLREARGHSRHPVQVVLTNRGDLPVDTALLYNEPSLRVIVIASSPSAAALGARLASRSWVQVIDAGQPFDSTRALQELHERGISVISAIGGRRTAQALFNENLVRDLYLTTAAQPGGEPDTPLSSAPLPRHTVLLEKEGRDVESGVRLQHFVFEPSGISRR